MDGFVNIIKYIHDFGDHPIAVILTTISVFTLGIWGFNIINGAIPFWYICVLLFFAVLIAIVWYVKTRRLPRCPNGYRGILMAIYPEEDNDAKVLENDFIRLDN